MGYNNIQLTWLLFFNSKNFKVNFDRFPILGISSAIIASVKPKNETLSISSSTFYKLFNNSII